jgi:hypothetical protein
MKQVSQMVHFNQDRGRHRKEGRNITGESWPRHSEGLSLKTRLGVSLCLLSRNLQDVGWCGGSTLFGGGLGDKLIDRGFDNGDGIGKRLDRAELSGGIMGLHTARIRSVSHQFKLSRSTPKRE